MIENRNRNTLLSLLTFPQKANNQDSSALESRQKMEERIEWALGNAIAPSADRPEAVTNLQFEAIVNRMIPAAARVNAFYAKVAGASSTSTNGMSHAEVIQRCKTFDVLRLGTTSGNLFAPNALALFSRDGDRIGYLDSQLTNRTMRNCGRWMAIFRRKNCHPETGAVIGAVVYMIHLTEQFARTQASKAALREVEGF
jgi:hypothetical protein